MNLLIKFIKILKYRFFEILPGSMVWLTFILAIVVSFIRPLWAIYFIIVFDLYWLFRVYYLTINLLVSWTIYRKHLKVDWLYDLKSYKDTDWTEYYHLIFLPTYKESLQIINSTFLSLTESAYPTDKFIIVLAGEERDRENFENIASKIKNTYENFFYKILFTVHPEGLPDEIPGKGSNLNYAGRLAQKLVDSLGIKYEKIIVSTFDIDTQPHRQYFSYLTYKYLTHPNPTHASFQPLALYHNNVWESDPVTRVVANSTTLWLLSELARSERLFTFSSHSMSFVTLVKIGFWQKDIVTEDSRIFLQCLFYYDGDYKVEPMYIPISMNTVFMGNFWKSLSNQYKQMRRWAWGVEHLPYMIQQFKKHPKMPFRKKFYYLWNQGEGTYSWATAPILILILGRLPLWLANKGVQANVISQNAPLILETIMNFALIGLIVNAFLSYIILPVKPRQKHWVSYVYMFLQWILFPVTMILFGSVPATDAQTRMMLGGRFKLGFWVTEKNTVKKAE